MTSPLSTLKSKTELLRDKARQHVHDILHRSLTVSTAILLLNLGGATAFVLFPSYSLRLAGYLMILAGVLGCIYALALLNQALNEASDQKVSLSPVYKYFLAVFCNVGALFIFYKIYQGEVPYITQNIQVTIKNTSYAPVDELRLSYGGMNKTIQNLKPNEAQTLSFYKMNGSMEAILKHKDGDRTAQFNIAEDNYKVLLRVDWQNNIMPELK